MIEARQVDLAFKVNENKNRQKQTIKYLFYLMHQPMRLLAFTYVVSLIIKIQK